MPGQGLEGEGGHPTPSGVQWENQPINHCKMEFFQSDEMIHFFFTKRENHNQWICVTTGNPLSMQVLMDNATSNGGF